MPTVEPTATTRLARRFALRSATSLALLLAWRPGIAHAQRKGQEFTRQGLLVPNFATVPGVNRKAPRRAGDAVRSRLGKLSDKHEVDVIDGFDIHEKMTIAGYNPDSALSERDLRTLGRLMRADEYVIGTVVRDGDSTELRATLVLMRDERLRQPLPPAVAPRFDDAAAQIARSLAAARRQLAYERRCENAMRDGHGAVAVKEARDGVAAYPASTLARTCLVWALRATGATAAEVLETAQAVLAVDSTNPHALEAGATSLDSLRRRNDAAAMWLRLAATDTANLDLTQRVLFALTEGGNTRHAEPLAITASDAHPDHLPLLREKWRIAFDLRDWPVAVAAGETMLRTDSLAVADPVFFQRLATAYRSSGQPFKSVETVAHGVSLFPKEPKLYALYTQFVREEADSALPRGLALFPKDPGLLALQARELRARGRAAESADAMKAALAADSTLPGGHLMLAQAELELGRPDSALVSLRHALGAGEDSTRVAQFAFARGNALYRAAGGTKSSADFALALRFLTFADSVRPSAQSRFLVGAAALGLAQAALTEATSPALATDRPRSCALARLGADMLPIARAGIEAGADVMPDAVKQSLDYLGQLEPYAGKELGAYCQGLDATVGATTTPATGAPAAPDTGRGPAPDQPATRRTPGVPRSL